MRYLCLHGFTGAPESFAEIQLPPGSLAPTLGGHLGADVTPDFPSEVERLAALGVEAGCEGLLGYSLGGRLALGILARYPHRFAHAVLVSAQPGLATDEERRVRRLGDARWVELLRERGLTAFVDAWQALPLWASQADWPESRKRAQRELRLRHSAEGLARSLLHHGLGEMTDLRPFLSQVEADVDLLVGARDLKFVALGEELRSRLPRARLSVAPGAGHQLLLERAELCSRLLRGGGAS